MSELSHRTHFLRELTEGESKALKMAILDIYKDVSVLCDRNGLVYMMSGGSCLGAIRHQGFIPWDDDLDIMMPREDYNKLVVLLEGGGLGEKYEFTYPQKNRDANNVFLKIFRKNSLDVELMNVATPYPKGIFLDVFPIDAVPQGWLSQEIKGFFANVLQFLAIARLTVQYPSAKYEEFANLDKDIKKRYQRKKFIGKLVSFATHAKWVYWFDKFVACTKQNRPWGIPTGRQYYNGEIFEKDVFVPVRKAKFEGLEVNVPNDTHKYLTNLYKNYMELPPIEKRERHFICEFRLPDE